MSERQKKLYVLTTKSGIEMEILGDSRMKKVSNMLDHMSFSVRKINSKRMK